MKSETRNERSTQSPALVVTVSIGTQVAPLLPDTWTSIVSPVEATPLDCQAANQRQ